MNIKWLAFLIFTIFLSARASFGQQVAEKRVVGITDSLKQKSEVKQLKPGRPVLGKYDYYNHLGAACKAEFKLEKATKIPFRFRLGSLQQTDYMEQKPNAQKP